VSSRVVFGTYNGLLDPLGRSQILPYVEGLHSRWPTHVLSFERPERLADAGAVRAMAERLTHRGIGWTRLRYHKWPSLIATTFDLLAGAAALRLIMRRNPVGLFHSRGYVPMAMAVRASRSLPILFDIRGLQPEEYVEGGNWREGELKWRLAKRDEERFFRRAAAAVVLTDKIRPVVEERFSRLGRDVPIAVIPCCVDTALFAFDPEARASVRRRIGAAPDDFVVVYSGSLGTWYRPEQMARFVARLADATGRVARMMWLVNNDAPTALRCSEAAGLAADRVHVMTVAADDMPAHLSAADGAVALIAPSFSKQASSPTKYAEYLSVGLPIAVHSGVGDGDELVSRGAAVDVPFPGTDDELRHAGRRLVAAAERGRGPYRALAAELFDVERVAIPRYSALYGGLLNRTA
jgi:glycosyltransferase involved in cell wall biosynthesis